MRSSSPPRPRTLPRSLVLLAGLVALVVLVTGAFIVFGAPPKVIALATGPPGSAYAAIGERYRTLLARSGITLKLVPTAGDAENLAKLADPKSGVSAAFVISGLPGATEVSGLASLGTIGYEPLWLFERATPQGIAVAGVAGKRISLDLAGSGTHALVHRLFKHTGLDVNGAQVFRFTPQEAAERLLRDELDVVALVADWESPVVRRLAADPRISIVSFRRADALVALNPDLRKLTLPAGTGNFGAGLPPTDVELVAPKSSLLVRDDVHDAIQYLLLEAASKAHAQPGIFHLAGTFPGPEAIEFPLSDEAVRYYKSGRPFFQRHLPFWAAVLVERMLFLLIPLVGILIPAVNGLTNGYRSLMQQRILALYGGLRLIEHELETAGPDADRTELLRRLDELEGRANRLRVPTQFAQMLYTVKDHVGQVRDRLVR